MVPCEQSKYFAGVQYPVSGTVKFRFNGLRIYYTLRIIEPLHIPFSLPLLLLHLKRRSPGPHTTTTRLSLCGFSLITFSSDSRTNLCSVNQVINAHRTRGRSDGNLALLGADVRDSVCAKNHRKRKCPCPNGGHSLVDCTEKHCLLVPNKLKNTHPHRTYRKRTRQAPNFPQFNAVCIFHLNAILKPQFWYQRVRNFWEAQSQKRKILINREWK